MVLSELPDRKNRRISVTALVSGIIMRGSQAKNRSRREREGGARFRFESAAIKNPRTGRTNCRIYGSVMEPA